MTGRLASKSVCVWALVLTGSLALSGEALGAPTIKKSIWGPVVRDGASQFPIYSELGVGLFQVALGWDAVAPRRPRRPRDPADPAYLWPPEIDLALSEAGRNGMRVSVMLIGAPPWANSGRSREWAPDDPADFADFARAASRRYPGVRYWMVWGEPTRQANFRPLDPQRPGRPLSRAEKLTPRIYSRILDAAYGSLKRVDRRDVVVGGNSFSGGDISPRNWIRHLRLRSGRPPRMDMYGHNPFGLRPPDLGLPPLGGGYADFGDLDTLTSWLDRRLRTPGGRRLPLFLSEYTVPSDHRNHEFNYWVTRRTQAKWLRDALRVARRWRRVHTLGWISLYDEAPRSDGLEVNRGLLDWRGNKKPAYYAFKRG